MQIVKRALLPGAFAAALAVALIVAWIVVRSRDATTAVPGTAPAKTSSDERVDVELATVADDSLERVEADESGEIPPPEDSQLTGAEIGRAHV